MSFTVQLALATTVLTAVLAWLDRRVVTRDDDAVDRVVARRDA